MLESVKKCVADAQDAASEIVIPELRIEAFKIILSKLLDVSFRNKSSLSSYNVTGEYEPASSGAENRNPELPVISPTDGLANNVRSLFATEWGSKRHSVGEVNT
ncbi:MAG: hypothetical protein ACREBU_22590, partial [Nitrososphaera sp.]